jgi:hypothetical protein
MKAAAPSLEGCKEPQDCARAVAALALAVAPGWANWAEGTAQRAPSPPSSSSSSSVPASSTGGPPREVTSALLRLLPRLSSARRQLEALPSQIIARLALALPEAVPALLSLPLPGSFPPVSTPTPRDARSSEPVVSAFCAALREEAVTRLGEFGPDQRGAVVQALVQAAEAVQQAGEGAGAEEQQQQQQRERECPEGSEVQEQPQAAERGGVRAS